MIWKENLVKLPGIFIKQVEEYNKLTESSPEQSAWWKAHHVITVAPEMNVIFKCQEIKQQLIITWFNKMN